jgi:uncharacterized protein DUF2442
MAISAIIADARVLNVQVTDDALTVVLRDGRKISAPLSWFPRLKAASPAARAAWTTGAAGHGIHWPDIDEDLSVEGLLRGQPAPQGHG